ncbi:gag/pol protein [Cucumis melo var. makuwa]|uniref:Gag/pol protein n=1 Tax=Cucumis melo var. makuwa TaxID=1194695 RepID=A0A5D3BI44_CUCMM|nr:gag/pol protein [Cucumis melo var. makuwa]
MDQDQEECPQTPGSNTNRTSREAYDRWVKANEKARVYILSSMTDVLAKKHESLATPKEIMNALKSMFEQSEWSLRHEAIKYIYTKRMKERTFVREHVLDMMMHFNIAEVNGGAIDEANQWVNSGGGSGCLIERRFEASGSFKEELPTHHKNVERSSYSQHRSRRMTNGVGILHYFRRYSRRTKNNVGSSPYSRQPPRCYRQDNAYFPMFVLLTPLYALGEPQFLVVSS